MHIMVELTISEEEIHTMTGLPLSQTFGHDADEFPANADFYVWLCNLPHILHKFFYRD